MDIYAPRKETIERIFTYAKAKLGRFFTHRRGLARVSAWVRLKFAALNLKKLAFWWASQSLPHGLFCCISSFFFLFLDRKDGFLTRREGGPQAALSLLLL